MQLRPYQTECLKLMLQPPKLKTKGFGIKLPTGAGKTVIFSKFASELKNKNILIVVHREEILNQTIKKLKSFDIKANIEKASLRADQSSIKEIIQNLDRSKENLKIRVENLRESITFHERELEKAEVEEEEVNQINKRLTKVYTESLQVWQTNLDLELAPSPATQDSIKKKHSRLKPKKLPTLATYRLSTAVENRKKDLTIAKLNLANAQNRLDNWDQQSNIRPSNVVVASVQSLHAERISIWDRFSFDYIIFDEAHHLEAKSWKAIQNYFCNQLNFAFSATLHPEVIGYDLLYQKNIEELIKAGYLARPLHIKKDLINAGIQAGTREHDKAILEILNKNPHEKTIIFTASVSQSELLAKTINKTIPAASITSTTPADARRKYIEDFAEGKIRVLCNFLIMTEGFDDPGATMIVAKNTTDADGYMQTVGRGFRLFDNKTHVKIVDIVTRRGQVTLPSIFGLHSDWEFEKEPLEDFLTAQAYAKEHDLDLPKFQNWGFLRLKNPNTKKSRRDVKSFESIKSNSLSILSNSNYGKSKYVTVVAPGASRFYSEAETIRHYMKESLSEALTLQPIKNIDPSTLTVDPLLPLETKRLIAMKFIKKYKQYDRFLNVLFFKCRRYPLTEAQCDAAIRSGKALQLYEETESI